MSFVFVYITNPSKEEAKKLANHLLEEKLIACANLFPIKSLYWWEDKITEDEEVVLIGKTKEENYEAIKKEVNKVHPYDTPCIAKIPVNFNEKYKDWLLKSME